MKKTGLLLVAMILGTCSWRSGQETGERDGGKYDDKDERPPRPAASVEFIRA